MTIIKDTNLGWWDKLNELTSKFEWCVVSCGSKSKKKRKENMFLNHNGLHVKMFQVILEINSQLILGRGEGSLVVL